MDRRSTTSYTQGRIQRWGIWVSRPLPLEIQWSPSYKFKKEEWEKEKLEEEGEEESPSKFIPTSVPRPSQCLYTTHAEIPPYLFFCFTTNERSRRRQLSSYRRACVLTPVWLTFILQAYIHIQRFCLYIFMAGMHLQLGLVPDRDSCDQH
jgi:hypothetical protein